MKKIICGLLCVAGLATTSVAQVAIAPELGANITDMTMKVTNLASGSDDLHTAGKVSATVGALADIRVAGNIYFQPGIFYEMNGCKFNISYVQPAGR